MRARLLLAVLVLQTGAFADEATKLEPGEYEVVMRLELPHVEDMGAQKTDKVCISGGDVHGIVVLSENNPLARCPVLNIKNFGDELSFDLICEGHNQAVAQAKFRLWSDRFDGAFSMKMGGKNMTMTERQTGRRIGPCGQGPRS